VLTATYGKTFAMTPEQLGFFQFKSKQLIFDVYLTQIESQTKNKLKFLSKRNIHTYLNWMPVHVPGQWQTHLYDFYKEFSVTQQAVPFILIHI